MPADLQGGTTFAPWPFMVFALLAAGLAVAGVLSRNSRRKRLIAWAATVGWSYQADQPRLHERFDGAPFGQGQQRRSSEVVAGSFRGRPALSFTYQWVTGSGDDRQSHSAHVVAIELPAYLPRVTLAPDNALLRVGAALGMQDINTESDDFNRRWRLTAGDQRTAHAIIHPRVMERFLLPDARGTTTVISGTWAWTSSPGMTSIDAIGARVDLISDLADLIPRHVWLDHGYDPQ